MLSQIKLKSGRKLAYREFGAPDKDAVVFFHGFPGSSIQGHFFNESSFVKNFRVIAFDRPGFGGSEISQNSSFSDVARDVDELTEQLKITSYSVLGVSGGAPYSLATAALFPGKVKAIGLMCPLGPLHEFQILMKMPVKAQIFLMTARYLPKVVKWAMQAALKPQATNSDDSVIEKFAAKLPPNDLKILSNKIYGGVLSDSLQQAFQQGTQGPMNELKNFTSDWGGVDLVNLKKPCFIIHGAEDTVVPLSIGKHLSSKIENSRLEVIPNEGHFSLPIRHVDKVLQQFSNQNDNLRPLL